MKRETVERANEIIKLIDNCKESINYLQKYDENNGLTLYAKAEHGYHGYELKEDVKFEQWEIRLMIHNKKQRIQALDKELEELKE